MCSQDNVLDSPEQASMLNEVVYEHFLRQGQMAVAKCLIEVLLVPNCSNIKCFIDMC